MTRFDDNRGWLVELFRHDEVPAEFHPVMSYVSLTRPGIARGPHEHVHQTDLFCFLGPSTFRLYLWDNRKSSLTFGQKFQIDLGENRMASAIVPPGIVHAYKNIGTTDGIVYNAPNQLFAGEGKKEKVDEIRHEDDPESRFKMN